MSLYIHVEEERGSVDGGMVAEGAPQVRSQTLGIFLLSMSESASCEVLL